MINGRRLIELDKVQRSETFQAERYTNAVKAIAKETAKAGFERQQRIDSQRGDTDVIGSEMANRAITLEGCF